MRTRKQPGWKARERAGKPDPRLRPAPAGIVPTGCYTAAAAARLLRIRAARLAAEVPHRRDGRRLLFLGQHLIDWITQGPRK